MPTKSIKKFVNDFGRKLFSKIHKIDQISYGQTLSKKRCVLKSVSAIKTEDYIQHKKKPKNDLDDINFEFCPAESSYRGSVFNFQKIDLTNNRIDPDDSSSDVSSDSACDVVSNSSCDDKNCRFRKNPPKPPTKTRFDRSVETFIRIHMNTVKKEPEGVVNYGFRNSTVDEPNYETLNSTKEPNYETLNPKEPNYDILITKSDFNMEPNYENLKVCFLDVPPGFQDVDATSQLPAIDDTLSRCEINCPFKKIRDLVGSNRTYDEVIESLKQLHSTALCSKIHCQQDTQPTCVQISNNPFIQSCTRDNIINQNIVNNRVCICENNLNRTIENHVEL